MGVTAPLEEGSSVGVVNSSVGVVNSSVGVVNLEDEEGAGAGINISIAF